MKEQIKKVAEFHKAFGIEDSSSPTLIPMEDYVLREGLIREETNEYMEACLQKDLVAVADALGDQLYIIYGTILKHGMQHVINEVFDRIHESNMSKLDDEGKPIINGRNGVHDKTRPLGKVIKSSNFKEPDLNFILNDNR